VSGAKGLQLVAGAPLLEIQGAGEHLGRQGAEVEGEPELGRADPGHVARHPAGLVHAGEQQRPAQRHPVVEPVGGIHPQPKPDRGGIDDRVRPPGRLEAGAVVLRKGQAERRPALRQRQGKVGSHGGLP
jgi:hypothetical protein